MKCKNIIRSTEKYLWHDYVYYMDVAYVLERSIYDELNVKIKL